MSTMYDDFTVTLSSNVKVPADNKPALFETQLAKPIELPGDWEVALSTLQYPHNWLNIIDTYQCAILTELAQGESGGIISPREWMFSNMNSAQSRPSIRPIVVEETQADPDPGLSPPPSPRRAPGSAGPVEQSPPASSIPVEQPPAPTRPVEPPPMSAETGLRPFAQRTGATLTIEVTTGPSIRKDTVDGVQARTRINNYRTSFDLLPGNYSIEEILDCLCLNIKGVLGLSHFTIRFNHNLGKVIVTTDTRFTLACPSSPSLLELIGFKQDSEKYGSTDGDATKPKFHLCRFDGVKIASESPIIPAAISHMFIYSDIVDISPIGDTLAPLLGHFSVTSKYGAQGTFEAVNRRYVKVKPRILSTITIKTCTSTGDLVPFQGSSGLVICDLHFRRKNYYR